MKLGRQRRVTGALSTRAVPGKGAKVSSKGGEKKNSAQSPPQREGSICPTCGVQLPLTGNCDTCDGNGEEK